MREFMWEIEGYSGSVFAETYDEARELINEHLSIQEVEE